MDGEFLFDGEKYISSHRAHQVFGYTSDYVAQLCRAEKVKGKRIGKSWFVQERSLEEHKKRKKTSAKARDFMATQFIGKDNFSDKRDIEKSTASSKNSIFGKKDIFEEKKSSISLEDVLWENALFSCAESLIQKEGSGELGGGGKFSRLIFLT